MDNLDRNKRFVAFLLLSKSGPSILQLQKTITMNLPNVIVDLVVAHKQS